MPISGFRVEGYRSLKSVRWTPGTLNVLIGANGSGKSNLLRAMALLQQAVTGREFVDVLLRQGGVQNLRWDRQATEVTWGLLTGPTGLHTREKPHEHMSYELRLKPASFLQSGFLITKELLRECYAVEDRWEFVNLIDRDVDKVSVFDHSKNEMASISEELPPDQTLLSVSPLTSVYTWFFRNSVRSWSIHHDLPVNEGAEIRQAAVARVEKRISSDGQNLIPVLHTLYTGDREFKKQIDEAMRTAFGDEYEEIVFPPAADQRINLRIRWKSLRTEQSAADLSDGTIRFLLLLAILANPEPAGLIAIDEPEVGLHPGMFPIIAEFAAAAAEKATVVLTTHSPQLLDAFGENIPTTTVVRLVDGETQLVVLEGQKLRRWLEEFSLGSLFKSGELEELD
jgi:predicted ATPase